MIWGIFWRTASVLACTSLFVLLLILGGCGATPLTLRYTLPAFDAGDSCSASPNPLKDLRYVYLYRRAPGEQLFRLFLGKGAIGRAGMVDSFVVAGESLATDGQWDFYVVASDSTNLSCPSNIHSVIINARRPAPATDLRISP